MDGGVETVLNTAFWLVAAHWLYTASFGLMLLGLVGLYARQAEHGSLSKEGRGARRIELVAILFSQNDPGNKDGRMKTIERLVRLTIDTQRLRWSRLQWSGEVSLTDI